MREESSINSPEWSEEDDRALSRLLRDAGRRKPLPADFDEVKEAVLSEWMLKVRQTGRSRPKAAWLGLAAAASLLLVVGLILYARWSGYFAAPDTFGTLEASWGSVDFRGDPRLPKALVAGTAVFTEDGRASFRLLTGESVRLDMASRLTFESPTRVRLAEGAVYVDSGLPLRSLSHLQVETKHGTVRELGTQFEVRLSDGSLRIRVREGQVSLHRQDDVHAARAGEQLFVGADRTVERSTTPTYGADWEWVLKSAPPMAIEGESMLAFLQWVAREGGWSLRFAEEGLAESSSDITLHGSIEGLTPREALDVALAGSGLAYRLEDAELVVEEAR